jgi:mannose-6-phosphate isomerase-like protein (cupin superfamily)
MEATYDQFVATEGIPVLDQFAIDDLAAIELEPWERIGGLGAYVHLTGRGLANAFITEIEPGDQLKEQRHLFEASVYVIGGAGRTELWNDSGFEASFNWDRGAVFAIPLNVHYRLINRDAVSPTRLLTISNMPLMMNLFHDVEYIFNCQKDFTDRFGPAVTRYDQPGGANTEQPGRRPFFSGDLLPSAFDAPLPPAPDRGADGGLLGLELGRSSLGSHISEFPGRTYKKAHRHGAGAHVVLLNGTGYSLLWKGDHDEPIRVDWRPGAVVVPPEKWFHQHFNTGATPARYLALRFGGGVHGIIPDYIDNRPTREGGDQIEYEDEDPRISEMFQKETNQ